jgi:hypothetical protein
MSIARMSGKLSLSRCATKPKATGRFEILPIAFGELQRLLSSPRFSFQLSARTAWWTTVTIAAGTGPAWAVVSGAVIAAIA